MIRFAFFGSSEFSIHVLEALSARGSVPTVVVTTPDKPKGRGLELAPNIVKAWALAKNIPVLDPAKLDEAFLEHLKKYACAVSIVASYGKIIPEKIIGLPPHKTLNIHPSLLPKYRGATPIQSAMLDDAKDTGVTIIRLDKEMDHGPSYASKNITIAEWPAYEELEKLMGTEGGKLLAEALPAWIETDPLDLHRMAEVEQDHAAATFTKKIVKEDGLLDPADLALDAPSDRAYLAFRKIQAYHAWPGAYFFIEKKGLPGQAGKKIRVKITSASFENGKLVIEKVIPEGKKEMAYADFIRG